MRSVLRWVLPVIITAAVLAVAPARADADPLTGVKAIAARSQLNCAALTNGEVRCWGKGDVGQLGNGYTVNQSLAVPVLRAGTDAHLTSVVQVSVGRVHACARLTNKRVRCWGANTVGQLGNGTTTGQSRAVLVRNGNDTGPLENVTQVSVGANHTCARLTSGQLRCWGNNSFGQLGNGTTTGSTLPVKVRNAGDTGAMGNVKRVVTGERHTCALRTDGQARCWGDNAEYQLGDNTTTDRHLPRAVIAVSGPGPLTGIAQLATTNMHTCARLTNGEARCWGKDSSSQLSNGSGTSPSHRPSVVEFIVDGDNTPLTGVAQVSAGTGHTCFRMVDGQLRCAGTNASGQLGDPTAGADSHYAELVHDATDTGPLTGVAQVAAGASHTCARLTNAQVQCWGGNIAGQLGHGAGPSTDLPADVHLA